MNMEFWHRHSFSVTWCHIDSHNKNIKMYSVIIILYYVTILLFNCLSVIKSSFVDIWGEIAILG